MLSYVYFGTNDLERAIRFYNATLGTLGMRELALNYNADFDAAYVRDPDGNKICALCRGFTSGP